jgi:hypothetical protein
VNIGMLGSGYVINAGATGLTSASTAAFDIVTGTAKSLVLVSGGGQTAATSATLAPITMLVVDAAGNPKAGVTLSFAVTTGGGTVTPASAGTDAKGNASAIWTLGPTAGTQTLTVSGPGLTSIVVPATATGAATNQIVLTQQPTATQTAGVALAPAFIAEVRSPTGALLTTYTSSVTIAIGTNAGNATLSGVTSVNAVAGVATFANNSLNKSGTGYTIIASTPGASNATSTAFNVLPAQATALVLQSGGGQSGQPNTVLAAPIVVQVNDAFGNAVQGVAVSYAVTAGGGSVTPASATTNALGQASATWTIGAQGAQTLSVTSAGLVGSPLSVSATFGAGLPVTTIVSPPLDTITAFTDTRQLSAQGRDAAGNIVGGTWTWVSRTPSVATVSSAGVVTSIANGSTYIVATEAGGSKDSATIVVQQRIATINVNPLARSIYTGGLFTFTAQAVDGRGVSMVTQPAVSWSSSVPSVATVNATTGVATGVTIGSTQIRAQAGNTVGVSNLSVLTPITRIDVSFDSLNAPAPDVFTMTSLGDRRMYKAVARDTLLNVMTGVTFTWNSTNASVALIDSTTPVKARALSAANGVTTIQASAQGVTGGATLNVAQVLNSIDLSPTTATVAITGTTVMIARGKDANGRFISGGTFTYTSSNPAVATVGSTTGVVTGVTNGNSNITATSGNITSNTAVVSVNSSGAPIISFGRDTLGIGRGTSISLPVYLSKPNATAVTVNLAVADTFAFWSTASVSIPAGQTFTNATLNGRNAGTTLVYATDGSGTGFAGDTAVLRVQANLRMTSSNYGLNATDQIITQVLLSDPSPAGGTYVTFTYGTPGKASVSPDPAFIPAGQLASNLVITGIAAGNTTLTPSAAGVTGNVSNVQVGAAVLTISQTAIRLGQGQLDNANNTYIQVPQVLYSPLTINFTSTDTTIAIVPPTLTIGANNYYNYFRTSGLGRGTAQIVAAAPGWTPDTLSVIVTTPMVRITGGQSLNTTNGPVTFTVYAADSTRNIHARINSLAVRISSSDTTVIKVIDTLVTILPGGQQANGQVVPGGSGGTAWVYSTASGHTPDSTQYIVVAPKLNFNYTSSRLGAGQQDQFNIFLPNTVSQPVSITLTSSDSSVLATSQVVTVGAGGNNAPFVIRGKSTGSATLIASAVGYTSDTTTTIVTTPRLRVNNSGSIPAYSVTNTFIRTADSVNTIHARTTALTATVTSSDTTILKVDTVATIGAGSSQSQALLVTGVSPGTARIITAAPGHIPDSVTWTVTPAKLNLSWFNYFIGARQYQTASSFYVQTPQSRATPIAVTLTQLQPTKVGLSTTALTIPANSNIAYFTFQGLAPGRDTIIASAPGYLPDTGYVTVTSPKLTFLFYQPMPGTATTTSPPYTLTLYISDTLTSSTHYASDSVVVRAVSSDTNVIKPGQPFFAIPKNGYYATPTVIYTGVGTASITYTDSAGTGYLPVTTNTVTVTGPSLRFNTTTGMLGVRQQASAFEYYISVPNAVGSPLTVNLLSTDPRVATVPSTVAIPLNSNVAYFRVTAQDTIGTIQIQATATGYAPTAFNMQVTAPKFLLYPNYTTLNTTSPKSQMIVYAADQNGNTHEVSQAVVVTLSSSSPGVATIDSAAMTIHVDSSYTRGAAWTPGAAGTATLSASDNRQQVRYPYGTGTANISVVTPTPTFSNTSVQVAPGQYVTAYLSVPDAPTTTLTVPLGHSAIPHVNTPPNVVLTPTQPYQYFQITGTSVGNDTISATPSGHNTAKMVAFVALGRLTPSSWPTSVRAGDSVLVTLYTRNSSQTVLPVAQATTITLTPNANIQFVSNGTGSTVITSIVVPADDYQVSFWVKGVAPGTGSTSWSNASYTTYTNTVTVTP